MGYRVYGIMGDRIYVAHHLVGGSQIPFIFCTNSEDPQPSSFAIAKFDMRSFRFRESYPGVYDTKIRVREVW